MPGVDARVSTGAVQERVRERVKPDGVQRGTPAALRITGNGHWLDAGRPVYDASSLSIAGDDAIVEYVPSDLTLTARAGATLSTIARVTAAEGQWLALDPHGSPNGTLGATIATGSAGPLAHAFGTPRDNVLGIEAVTGTGDIVRAGGRVVKNVAGFDLTRLFTGAWGTLAVITEATVRLRARPERDETIALALPLRDGLERWLANLRALPFSPLALEMLNAPLATALGLGDRALLLGRLGGNDDSVREQLRALGALGETRQASRNSWSALAVCEPAGAAVVRVSAPPSRLHLLWDRLSSGDDGTLVHAAVGRGIVRCVHSTTAPLAPWLEHISMTEGTHIFERLPSSEWSAIPSRVVDPLSCAVRRAF
ncbi:MAG TPA: FAD-binding oxidoreductase, partial [Gemmatimonadaceae bacterium]